jgi:uncharacterized protein YqgV (UPF0045/DUF77 family)
VRPGATGSLGAVTLHAEFTVEPFTAGDPGPHVQAAFDAATAAGLDVEIGPFGTAIEGDDEQVIETVATILRASLEHGATRVSVQVETTPT